MAQPNHNPSTLARGDGQMLVRDVGQVAGVRSPRMNAALRQRVMQIASPIGMLIIWEILSKTHVLNPKFFPAPTSIIGSFAHLVHDGQLYLDLKSSLLRIVLGFLLGSIPGLIIGLTMGLFPVVRAVLEPVVYAIYPVPKLALLPLFMLIFGIGNEEMIFVIAAGAIFEVLINTVTGVVELDHIYWDVAKNLGASSRDYYTTVAIPGALPMIFTGLKLSMGMAILLIVAAETDGANHGIGFLIWRSYDIYNIKAMYVAFVMIALVGYVATLLLNELEHYLVKWKA